MFRKLFCSMFVMTLTAGLAGADTFHAVPIKVDGDKVTFQKYKGKKDPPELSVFVSEGKKDGDPVTLPIAKDAKILRFMRPAVPGGKIILPKVQTEPVEGGLKNELFNNIPQNGTFARFTTSEDKKTIIEITVLGFRSDPMPKEIVQPWVAAGAKVGFIQTWHSGRAFVNVVTVEKIDWMTGATMGRMPVFYLFAPNEGVVAKLPAPTTPFGLMVDRNSVTNGVMKEIAGLAHLQLLSLEHTKVTDDGLKELAALMNLRLLRIRSFTVTDAGLKHLSSHKCLEALELELGSTGLTDKGLKELVGLKNLQTLNVRNSAVTDAGLKELVALKSLQYLDLTRTKVTDKGLKDLTGLKNLQWLDLEGTAVTAEGVNELQTALPDCRISSKRPK